MEEVTQTTQSPLEQQLANVVMDMSPLTAQAKPAENAERQKPAEQPEKTVPKKLFDEKMSEWNKKTKALEAQLREKMTDDERKAAESTEKDAELQAMKNELAALKTESALTAAGIKPEIAKELSAAIVGADASAIVEAVKSAITVAEKEASAKATKELLEKGSPKVQTATGDKEKPDPNLALVKSAVQKPKSAPLSESKWF
ncbi:MAG: hypothetical protein NC299_11935 [Lachnospiraceae bacterium]|nr:hypothetical protein [Lachnospiraceae bacterium]